MKPGIRTVTVLKALPVRAAVALVLVGALGGCATDMLRSHEESHCRKAIDKLGEWTGEKGDASVDTVVSTKRVVDGKRRSIVNITYHQGGTGRLITCTYAGNGEGPALDIIYKNVHLTDDDLKRLNAAIK